MYNALYGHCMQTQSNTISTINNGVLSVFNEIFKTISTWNFTCVTTGTKYMVQRRIKNNLNIQFKNSKIK